MDSQIGSFHGTADRHGWPRRAGRVSRPSSAYLGYIRHQASDEGVLRQPIEGRVRPPDSVTARSSTRSWLLAQPASHSRPATTFPLA
jgi:hypothetical protein